MNNFKKTVRKNTNGKINVIENNDETINIKTINDTKSTKKTITEQKAKEIKPIDTVKPIKTTKIELFEEPATKNLKLTNEALVEDIENISYTVQKPFLKWVGGKTQIIETIVGNFPVEMENYHEIFLGGGSVLLACLSLKNEGLINIKKKIYAYDLNKSLIYLYKNIKEKPKTFINTIAKIINEFCVITGETINRKPKNIEEAKTSQESYYYWIRTKFNELNEDEQTSMLGSAYFLFLNKTCFRGVYRVGPNGFNVPYGHYNNPSVIDSDNIKQISALIKDVEFIHLSFENSILNVKKGDMVYLDPPYVPLNATSFVGYTSDGFDLKLHKKLFEMLHELTNKKINWMMSNSDMKLVTNDFSDNKKYSIEKILCKRAINSKKPGSKTNEVVIKSY